MLDLIVRQTLKNGSVKTWKLRSNEPTHTFGSSRLANVISIAPETNGIQGLFEYRDNHWWYLNLNLATSALEDALPTLCIENEAIIELSDSTLHISTAKKETDLYSRLERTFHQRLAGSKIFQIYIIRHFGTVLETKVLPAGKKFKSPLLGTDVKILALPSEEWQKQNFGEFELSQKTISLEDATQLGHISLSQLVDEDTKKGFHVLLGAALFIITVGLFAPKTETTQSMVSAPVIAQKIIVKNDFKPKRKKVEAAQQNPTPAAKETKVELPSSGSANKVSQMMQSLTTGRISKLIGKVSSQGARSANVVFANGTKAGSGETGRALAAVGNMDRSGRDWSQEGKGNQVVISTAGHGGGKSTSGLGRLTAGTTGGGGVGLIEDEGEIIGGLDREVIAQYIKSKLGQILYCYERQLSANPELFGKVAIKFTIGGTGEVVQQLINDSTLKNSSVEGCILNKVSTWKFPNPQNGTKVLVTYPFLFKSTN